MIGEQEFALMVSEDIKNRADQMTKDILRSPDNRERWKQTLIKIIKNISFLKKITFCTIFDTFK